MKPRNRCTKYVAVLPTAPMLLAGLLGALPRPTPAQDWKDNLRSTLETTYPLTKRATFSPDRITQQGIVLVVRRDGIAADPSSDTRYSVTNVRNGQLGEQGGLVTGVFSKKNTRVFRVGEHVYVTDIKVGDDNVMLLLMSVDMSDVVVNGSTRQTRYKAALKFEFPRDYLATAEFARVKNAIDSIVSTEAAAAAANTKTISLGQTPDEVVAILGQPDRIIDLGSKKIYVYKDMKVTFADGKVADVQ